MKKKQTYDHIRNEFLMYLLPKMIYTGSNKERTSFYDALKNDGQYLLYSLYAGTCREENISCPYQQSDFEADIIDSNGITLIQIQLPQYYKAEILKAYIVSAKMYDDRLYKKYFLLQKFSDGKIHLVYISPRNRRYLGREVTSYIQNEEHIRWQLISTFLMLSIKDMKQRKQRNKHGKDKAE